MGVLSDGLLETDSDSVRLCISIAKYLVQLFTNPTVNDTKFVDDIVDILLKPMD